MYDPPLERFGSRCVFDNVLKTLHSIYYDTSLEQLVPDQKFTRGPWRQENLLVPALLTYLKESVRSMNDEEVKSLYNELTSIEWQDGEADECIQTIARRLGKVSGLRVLYVYGCIEEHDYCAVSKLRKAFPEIKFICEEYPRENYAEAVEFLSGVIKREKIDLLIGRDLGGFIALNIPDAPKTIVLDPCMHPYEDVPPLRHNSPLVVFPRINLATYKAAEDNIWHHQRNGNVIGCFSYDNGMADEDVIARFKEHYGDCERIPQEKFNVEDAIPVIEKCLKMMFTFPDSND